MPTCYITYERRIRNWSTLSRPRRDLVSEDARRTHLREFGNSFGFLFLRRSLSEISPSRDFFCPRRKTPHHPKKNLPPLQNESWEIRESFPTSKLRKEFVKNFAKSAFNIHWKCVQCIGKPSKTQIANAKRHHATIFAISASASTNDLSVHQLSIRGLWDKGMHYAPSPW